MFQTYDVDSKNGVGEQEWAFMAIDNVHDYKIDYDCQNCLKNIRTELSKLFDFLDCDTNGYVHAVDIFTVLKQMKGGEDLTTTNANDWLLKEDIKHIGRLGRSQFIEAVLKSLYEINYL